MSSILTGSTIQLIDPPKVLDFSGASHTLPLQITLQKGFIVAGKIRHFLFRDGRYYARRVVPPELRAILGKSELRKPLGADRKRAIENLPLALVGINAKLDHARSLLASRVGSANAIAHGVSVVSPDELARIHYEEGIERDHALRNASSAWASIGIDDRYVDALRSALSGRMSDVEIEDVLGDTLQRYRLRGQMAAEPHSAEWREYARGIAEAELEVLTRMAERDEGEPSHSEKHPPHLLTPKNESEEAPEREPVSLRVLLEDHLKGLEANGRGREARRTWTRVFEDLIGFIARHRGLRGRSIRHAEDARRLTADELIAWRDEKLLALSPKTVKDVWVAAVKAVLGRAVEDRKLAENVAALVKVRTMRAPQLREKGYTDQEAIIILRTCLNYVAPQPENPAHREASHVTAAKKWGPWLCAFTGARVGEVLQLRKSDVRTLDGIHYLHITPEAGTVKTQAFRDVPIHDQLIELGFLHFVDGCEDGPLFFSADLDPETLPAKHVASRVSKWLQKMGAVPKGVAPNHGWRHRFKTLTREAAIDPRVVDAIQGHTGRTASDGYGDVTLRTKKAALDKLAEYPI